MPGDSAYKTAVRDALDDEQLAALAANPGDKHGPWSHEALLLAAAVDRLELLRRDLVAVNGGKPPGQFQPYPRPGVARPKRRTLSAEGLAYLTRLREEHEALYPPDPAPAPEPDGDDAG